MIALVIFLFVFLQNAAAMMPLLLTGLDQLSPEIKTKLHKMYEETNVMATREEALPYAEQLLADKPSIGTFEAAVNRMRVILPQLKQKGVIVKSHVGGASTANTTAKNDAALQAAGLSPEARAAALGKNGDANPVVVVVKPPAEKHNGEESRQARKRSAALLAEEERERAGGNGNYRHCESGRETQQLHVDAFPDLSLLHPLVELHLRESDGQLRFGVEVPYIPFDAHYIVSFEPIVHAKQRPLACSSNYNEEYEALANGESLTHAMKWGHAPNANYRDAFSSLDRYGAYYNAPSSKWRAKASGCSHVQYEALFGVEELLQCRDTAEAHSFGITALGEKNSVVVISGTVHVSILRPQEGVADDESGWQNANVAATWAHPFVVMIDENDSKVAIMDSANGGLRRRIDHGASSDDASESENGDRWRERALDRVETLARSVRVDEKGHLEIVLQTASYERGESKSGQCDTRPMQLSRIMHKHHKSQFTLHRSEKDPQDSLPYCVDADADEEEKKQNMQLQNWRLVSSSRQSAYDGDFVLLFCAAKSRSTSLSTGGSGPEEEDNDQSDQCDESTALHRTSISIRVSNPLALDDASRMVFHSEITQHRDLSRDRRPHTGAFESGDRVCMQTYVVGPKELTQQMEVELLEAWLCTSDTASAMVAPAAHAIGSDDALRCADSEHALQLYGANSTVSALPAHEALNVTIQYPGIYGMLSVGVCFNSDARFIDAQGRSVVQRYQRYESRVRMHAATLRRNGAAVVQPIYNDVIATLDALVGRGEQRYYDKFVHNKLAHIQSQSQQQTPFAPQTFERSLHQSRAQGQTYEEHSHHFEVQPRTSDEHLANTSHGAAALFIVFFALFLVFVCAIYVMWSRRNHCIYYNERLPQRSHAQF